MQLMVSNIIPLAVAATGYFPGEVVFHDWEILRYYYYYFLVNFSDYPFVVKLAFQIVAASVLAIIVMTIIFFRIYFSHRRHDRYKGRIIKTCDEDLTRMYIAHADATAEQIAATVHRLEPMKKKLKRWRGRIWVEYLVDLRSKNFTEKDDTATIIGQTKVIRMISDALELDSYIEYVIRFCSVRRKITIIDAAKILNIEIPESLMSRMVNDKHANLRLNARLSYMHTSTHNTYRYLEEGDTIKYTTAIGMELHDLFKENVRLQRELPSFVSMIYKQSDMKMKAFLIIEKACWGVFDSKFLTEMLNHQNIECRYAAINACGIFKRREMEGPLLEIYDNQSERIKCEIMKAIFKIRSGHHTHFFYNAYKHAISDMSRETALQCLWNYNDDSRALFYQIELNASEKDLKIFNHVKHSLIMDKFDNSFQFTNERSA